MTRTRERGRAASSSTSNRLSRVSAFGACRCSASFRCLILSAARCSCPAAVYCRVAALKWMTASARRSLVSRARARPSSARAILRLSRRSPAAESEAPLPMAS